MEFQEIITVSLQDKESKEKYFNILSSRIEQNKRLQARILFVMLFTAVVFFFLPSAKISEISIGPLKVIDTTFALRLVPIVFSYAFYQYITVLFDLSKQRNAYQIIASQLFDIPLKSTLTRIISHYSFTESLANFHEDNESQLWGCLSGIFWLPSVLFIVFFPFWFEVHTIRYIYIKFGLSSTQDQLLFFLPILLIILTTILNIQMIRKDLQEQKAYNIKL